MFNTLTPGIWSFQFVTIIIMFVHLPYWYDLTLSSPGISETWGCDDITKKRLTWQKTKAVKSIRQAIKKPSTQLNLFGRLNKNGLWTFGHKQLNLKSHSLPQLCPAVCEHSLLCDRDQQKWCRAVALKPFISRTYSFICLSRVHMVKPFILKVLLQKVYETEEQNSQTLCYRIIWNFSKKQFKSPVFP